LSTEKKIKVLRIINRFNLGGPTYNVTFLSAFLPDTYKTMLVGGKHESYEGESMFIPNKYNVNPVIVDSLQREINLKTDYKAYKDIRQIIKDYKPDIVHTHASKAGLVGRLAAKKENVPVIIHTFHGHVFHSYFGKVKTTIFKIIERYLAKKSNAIIAISELQKKELVNIHKIVNSDKVRVVNLGFDLSKFQVNRSEKRRLFSEEYNIQVDDICIGIIGRLTPIKNHGLFLDVMSKVLNSTNKKIKVFVIGDGELMDELQEKVNLIEESLGKKVFVFTSWIKDIDLPLSRLDIVALTSHNEGTPVSLIEAQASNVPVISTNVGGVKDILDENNTGFVRDDFSTDDFSEKMLELIENKNKRDLMSQNGWSFVKDKFHYTTLCNNIDKLYKELL
jgi:glycosyltransferase involved in cell wall biosynthesis